jgi:hypothetical protein
MTFSRFKLIQLIQLTHNLVLFYFENSEYEVNNTGTFIYHKNHKKKYQPKLNHFKYEKISSFSWKIHQKNEYY